MLNSLNLESLRNTLIFAVLFIASIHDCWSYESEKDSVLSRELQLIVDNDVFLFVHQDRYYTSGIYAKYRRLLRQGDFGAKAPIGSSKFEKSIITYSFHHRMFTPNNIAATYEPVIDRPYAGWVDVGLGLDYLYIHSHLNFRFDVGWMGPANQTEKVQVLLHDVLNLRTPRGWGEFQVVNRPVVQLKTGYTKKILGNENIDITGETEFNVGSILNSLKGGVNIRLGFFSQIGKSSYSDAKMGQKRIKPAQISADDKTQELYLFFNTSTSYILYNATIQSDLVGGSDKFSGVSETIIREQRWGLTRSGRYFDFSIVVNIEGPDIVNNKKHKYVTIGMSYRL